MINRVVQFCFRPTSKQRYGWSLVQAFTAVALAITSAFMINRGRYIEGGIDAFLCVSNAFFGWVNQVIYFDWKRKNPKQ